MSTSSTATTAGSAVADLLPSRVTDVLQRVRGRVGRVAPAARGLVRRLGGRLESFVSAKIKRRIKPPIMLALVLAGLALAAATVALLRK